MNTNEDIVPEHNSGTSNLDEMPKAWEPKMNNRFYFTFPEYFDIKPWIVKSVERPYIMVGQTIEYSTMRVTLYDPLDFSVPHRLYKIMDNIKNGNPDYNEFVVYLDMLDPTGMSREKWEYTCSLDMILSSDLAYDIDNISTHAITLSVHDAKLI